MIIEKAILRDRLIILKQDVENKSDFEALYTYSYGDEYFTTIEEDEEYYYVPSNSIYKLTIKNIIDERIKIDIEPALVFNGVLRPEQMAAIRPFFPNGIGQRGLSSGLLQAPCGWGKCKPYFSKILTNKGYLTLEELKNTWKDTQIINHRGLYSIKDFYDNKEEECFEVRTELGNIIRGTGKHPLLCWNPNTLTTEFKKISEIKKEDYVIGKFNTNLFGADAIDDPYLLGLLIGDGSLTVKNKIGLSSGDLEIVEYFKKYFKNYNVGEVKKANHSELYVYSKEQYEKLITSYGLNCKSIDKKIHKKLRSLNRDQTILLLKGLFDTDGCSNIDGTIEFCSSSEDIAYFVFEQLLNLGILSTIRKKKTTHNDTYVINIDSKLYCEKYYSIIGFYIKRKQERSSIAISKTFGSSRKGILPNMSSLVYNLYSNNLVGKGLSDFFYNYKNCNISLHKYKEAIMLFKNHKIQYESMLDYLIDCYSTKVTNIKSIGIIQTYDIEVDDESHCYLSEGIINHNTFAACNLIAEANLTTIVIVHTKLLFYQWIEELKKLIPNQEIGVIGDGKFSLKPITVAIYKSANNNLEQIKNQFSLIIVDEAHLCPAETFSHTVNSINSKYKIAITATPSRKDGHHLVLPDYFGDKTVVAKDYRKLADCFFEIIKTDKAFIVLNPNRDWTNRLSLLAEDPTYVQLVVDKAKEKIAEGRCLLILSERVGMLKELQKLIPNSRVLIGETPQIERDKILEQAGKGVSAILTTKIFDEGISCHRLDTLFLTCPNNNLIKLEQRTGRIIRQHPDKKNPLIVDFWFNGHIVHAQQSKRIQWYLSKGFKPGNVF